MFVTSWIKEAVGEDLWRNEREDNHCPGDTSQKSTHQSEAMDNETAQFISLTS